jgi:hypothetical protein
MCLQPVSQLEPQVLEWLWPYRLALGKLAIVDGDPGLGKSLLTLDICARLSTGRPLPDGSPGPGVCNSIILNGEDGARDTIRPRLLATGADAERVFVLNRKTTQDRQPLSFPSNLSLLEQALAETRARLVVIDPIMAFLDPGVNIANDQSVRRALFPLMKLASEYRCAVQMVRHLNKSLGFRSVYRGGGSIGISGACRTVLLAARDPYHPQRCVLAEVKKNLAVAQPSLAYTIQRLDDVRATVTWHGPTPWTADQLLAAAARAPAGVRALDRACDFLQEVLQEGPVTSRQLWALAQEQRLTKRTLQRAKRDLAIRSVRVWAEGKRLSYWLLPGQQLPAGVPPEAAPPDLEEYLAPLREEFPPLTPLDDL